MRSELRDHIITGLWMEFKRAGEPPWCTLTFDLDRDWRYKVKYGYEIDLDIDSSEREIRWAYDELGIIPEYSYEKKMLERYLKNKTTKN